MVQFLNQIFAFDVSDIMLKCQSAIYDILNKGTVRHLDGHHINIFAVHSGHGSFPYQLHMQQIN